MRLHVFSLDFPDREQRVSVEYVQIEDCNYEGKRVVVDNCQFRHCSFVRCVLIFSGGPFGFSECEVDNSTEVALTGAAMRGQLLLRAFQARGNPFLP